MRRYSVLRLSPGFWSSCSVALGCLACSGQTDGTTPMSERDPMAGTGVPGVVLADAQGECLEVRSYPEERTPAARTRGSWSADDRILTEVSSNDGSDGSQSLKWRYRSDGQVIAYVGVEQPFQHDYEYDEHGNQIDFYLSYPALPDLMSASTAPPWLGRSFVNEYDSTGRLTASTAQEYGEGTLVAMRRSNFSEDAEGRCIEVDSGESGREVRTYDDAGRLSKIERLDQQGSSFVIETSYDEHQRLLSRTETWQGAVGIRSGVVTTQHTYRSDGSEVVEVLDGLTDSGGAHTVTTRSAACLAIDAAIGRPADARCRVEL